MKELNLPTYSFRIRGEEGSSEIFDYIRLKWVKLTPEEWVRQNFVRYLVEEGKYPPGLLGIEKMFVFNKLRRRTDILVHDRTGKPVMIVECKSHTVHLSENEAAFDQIVCYNLKFGVSYVVVTNGLSHYACKADNSGHYEFMNYIPLYEDLTS